MSSAQLFTIVDDSISNSFAFGPQSWTSSTLSQWFNATSQSPTFALSPNSTMGTVKMVFQGTSVAFYGNTPTGSVNQTFSISIDGGTPYSATYADPNPPSYRQWYQSPLLYEGAHDITLFNLPGDLSVDFAVVSVGQNTPLNGTTVIADNDDSGFKYIGSWTRSLNAFNSGPQLDGLPYHNSTHRVSEIGSLFIYEFTGNSAAIYGIFNWANLGELTLTFTLDAQPLVKTYTVRSDTPQFIEELGQQENFLFYEYNFLQAGNHTLIVNLTECVNQTFMFDYITYGPSFANLATMPSLAPMNITMNTNTTQASVSKNNHAGIITGIISAAAIILFLCGIIFCLSRRKGKYQAVYPFHGYPFSNRTVTIVTTYQAPKVPHVNLTSLHPRRQMDYESRNEPRQPLLSNVSASLVSGSPATGVAGTRPVAKSAMPWRIDGQPAETLPSYDESTRSSTNYSLYSSL